MTLWRFYVEPGWHEVGEIFEGTKDEAERRAVELSQERMALVCAEPVETQD